MTGSDLLSAINATFEKMKSLQDNSLLTDEDDRSDGREHGIVGSSDMAQIHREESTASNNSSSNSHSISSSSSISNEKNSAGAKCKLYRDPSLHRRRTFNAAIKNSPSSEAISSADLESKVDDAFI